METFLQFSEIWIISNIDFVGDTFHKTDITIFEKSTFRRKKKIFCCF